MALVAGVAHDASSSAKAEAAVHNRLSNHPSKPKPKEKACKPNNQVKLALTHVGDTSGTEYYIARARACKKTTPKLLKKVKLDEKGPEGQHRDWILKKLAPGHQQSRGFTLELPQQYNASDRKISLKAFSSKGKRIGAKSWKLEDIPEEPPSPHSAILQQELAEAQKSCTPDPDYRVGIADDNQFVFQQDITRNEAFSQSTRILGANLLRINMIYGLVQAYGLQPYKEAVDDAIDHGYKVDLTIMSTPKYLSAFDSTLSWANRDPNIMREFAKQIAQTFGNKILYYSVENEPNINAFNQGQDPNAFKQQYLAGREGILQAYPEAKVIAGELANVDMDSWINVVNGLPNDGVAIHPYGGAISRTDYFKNIAKTQLIISEYGNFRGNPNQLQDDLAVREIMRCKGMDQVVFYQLVRDPEATWNTGLIDPPGNNSKQNLTMAYRMPLKNGY